MTDFIRPLRSELGPTDAAQWAEVERVFAGALDRTADARASYLNELTTDPAVREQVARLLEQHELLEADSAEFLSPLSRERAAHLVAEADEEPTTVGRYTVQRVLGRGAFGTVYLAHDPELGRDVAIKRLASHLSVGSQWTERLAAEARIASRLNHPHIVTVHDIGRADDGRLFIVMGYEGGGTLRDVLAHGPVSIRTALTYAAEVADGLAAAHGAGLVHRDIKPENLLATPRGVRIADFGIAKAAAETAAITDDAFGTTVIGTAAYMSPEQSLGHHVDVRSDIWSLGVVLFELLTGVRPFSGATVEETLHALRTVEPPAPSTLRAEIPARVDEIVSRCLQRKPSDRFASAASLREALDDAARALSGSAASSTSKPTKSGMVPATVLAVAAVALLALAWQTLRPDSGAETSQRIALGATVGPLRPADPVAYELYLRGKGLLDPWNDSTIKPAAFYYREAIARDSTFARAWLGLAETYLSAQATPPAERFRLAKPLVARALAAEPNLAEAHQAAGWIAFVYDHDWIGAEQHFLRAIALDPNDIWSYHRYAALLSATGRPDSSLAITRRAMPLDPDAAATTTHYAIHLYMRRQYAEAISLLENLLTRDTSWTRAFVVLGRTYLAVGRSDEALPLLRKYAPQYVGLDVRGVHAHALVANGRRDEAEQMVAGMEVEARALSIGAANLVVGHLALGDTSRALDWLERVPDDRGHLLFLLTEPFYDPLRGSPRWRRVIDRLGLTAADTVRRAPRP